MIQQVPPHSLEAERAVIGSMLIDRAMVQAVITVISPRDCYTWAHEAILGAIYALDAEGEPVDKVAVSQRLREHGYLEKVGGVKYLSECMEVVPTAASADYYAKIVREKAQLRSLISASTVIAKLGYEGEDDADGAIAEAEQVLRRAVEGFHQIDGGEQMPAVLERVWRHIAKGGQSDVLKTPWPALDACTGGFLPGEFIVWASAPAMGKSGLVSMLADYTAAHYGDVAFFALEMGTDATVRRMIATYSGVSSRDLRNGNLRAGDYDEVETARLKLKSRPIQWFDRDVNSIARIRQELRRLSMTTQVRAVVIDHAGFIADARVDSRRSRNDALDNVYVSLMLMAKEMGFVLHIVQHVNREGARSSDPPTISHLRDGGNIEGHAHAVIFPHRPHHDDNDPELRKEGQLCVRKARDGEEGVVAMTYDGARHLWLQAKDERGNLNRQKEWFADFDQV